MSKIQERFNLPTKKFPSYSKTRWWSILKLINVIIEQELCLTSFLRCYKNGEHKRLTLKEDEGNILKHLSLVLQPIREITDNLAADSYVTGSIILPVIFSIKSKLSEILNRTNEINIDCDELQNNNNNLMKKMYTVITELFDLRYKNNTTLILCSVIDPRFKNAYIEPDVLTDLQIKLSTNCENTWKLWQQANCEGVQILKDDPIPKKKKNGLFAIFDTSSEQNLTQEVKCILI